jgi:non-ribosomal peptide synthetase-like protein
VSAHDQPLHAFFAQSARRWPDAVAVDVPPGRNRPARQTITYAELARHSDALAHLLRPLVTGESIVAILAGRDAPWVFAAQLAVLKAGAAYTCIDPAVPDEPLRDTLADSDAVALLADPSGCTRAGAVGFPVPPIVDVAVAIRNAHDDLPPLPTPAWLTPRTLAYVIYTSGSTGRPKGVMIEHASMANLVSANLETFDLGPGDRVGQSSSVAYDSSLEETWLAFASGATLVVIDDDTVRLGPDLVPWLRREHINVLCPPPTLLRTTGCSDPDTALPDLRLLYVGGEALPEDIADRWARGRQLVNGYGPTEATVTAIRERILDGRAIAIGEPVRGAHAWILNEAGETMPDEAHGELCLGGAGLARGYRHLPDLTARKFPMHPRLGRIFRTGDLAHRSPDGRFFYHGRIDSLVKLRGYRIELEAVEARLAECAGVREAACCVQGDGARETLVAFVVPEDPRTPPRVDELRASLEAVLPPYMVPSRIGVLRGLPTTASGKLDRAGLPALDASPDARGHAIIVSPRTPLEQTFAAAFRQVLNLREPISIHDDFFRDLGGDSLGAAILISLLREDQATAAIATRDLYETLTVARLAERARAIDHAEAPPPRRPEARPPTSTARVCAATMLQGLWLVVELMIGAPVAYLLAFRALPWLAQSVGLVPVILLAPILWTLGRMALALAAVLATVVAKTLLIGRYRPLRAPAWSGFYVRNWIVHRMASLIPWEMLAGTEFFNMALRALGSRIGRRVHIHRGVDLRRGGWDLLDIGDDVTIARDTSMRLVDVDRGCVEVGAIAIGDRATLDVRAGMGPNSSLAHDASLTPWSSLPERGHVPAGERWDGIPAAPAGHTPPAPSIRSGTTLDPLIHAAALAMSRSVLWCLIALPIALLAIALVLALGLNTDSMLDLVFRGSWTAGRLSLLIAAVALAVPITLALQAVAVRALGATQEGVISRWSWAYIRVALKSGLLESASTWLSGTLFWPIWLRQAGMLVGPKGEISTIIDTVPDLVDVGPECFLADGIYLAGPRIDRGTVTLARVRLGARTFIGNHAVIPCGVRLPDDVLLGVCTVADPDRIRPGSSWFGHPPLELPRREIVSFDRRLTHDPSLVRYANRVFWELLRCVLPAGLLLVGLGWIAGVSAAEATWTPWSLWLVAVPLWTFAGGATLCALVLVLKWALMVRVHPGTHALWSCWCSRWDFLYVAWGMYGRGLLTSLEGTLWLSWYLRAMGMTLGRRVLLGYGFAQVVDPDMIVIEDEATVSAMVQAHTFEDRVLKIDRVYVRRGATMADATVPLYGADIGAGAHVAAHSVVMKRERLAPGTHYAGAPTRPVGAASSLPG